LFYTLFLTTRSATHLLYLLTACEPTDFASSACAGFNDCDTCVQSDGTACDVTAELGIISTASDT